MEPFYKSFAVDVDWPWWVTVITAGVSKIVEEFIEGKIEAKLKPAILTGVKDQIDDLVDQIPGGLRLHSLSLAENEIRVTVCPGGPHTPFLVLATSGQGATTRPAEPAGQATTPSGGGPVGVVVCPPPPVFTVASTTRRATSNRSQTTVPAPDPDLLFLRHGRLRRGRSGVGRLGWSADSRAHDPIRHQPSRQIRPESSQPRFARRARTLPWSGT